MERIGKSRTALALFVMAIVSFGLGAATRGGEGMPLQGSIVDVVAVRDLPADVDRWCLIRDGAAAAANLAPVAIVEFGHGRSRHRYAYPRTPASNLAPRDFVSSDIDTCSIMKIAATADRPQHDGRSVERHER